MILRNWLSVALIGLLAGPVSAAYILEIDTDGADDGVLTYNSNFSYGADTLTASQSSPSTAFGMTGGDSIFGGDGTVFADTYVYAYSPAADADNLVIPAGTDLGDGVLATGITGGGPGTYSVYATWPFTENVSGGDTLYAVNTIGANFVTSLDQNMKGNSWIKLGEIDYTAGAIIVTQSTSNNTFVSMRSAGLLFEPVPEPSSLGLIAMGLLAFLGRRRR